MGLLAPILSPSGLTHGGPPIPSLLFESSRWGTYGTKPCQQPPSAWQVSFCLKNSKLPSSGEVVESSALSRIIGHVPDRSGRVPSS
jgi:hypothetical protein